MIHSVMSLAHARSTITLRVCASMDESTICSPAALAGLPQHAKLLSLTIHLNMLYPRRGSAL